MSLSLMQGWCILFAKRWDVCGHLSCRAFKKWHLPITNQLQRNTWKVKCWWGLKSSTYGPQVALWCDSTATALLCHPNMWGYVNVLVILLAQNPTYTETLRFAAHIQAQNFSIRLVTVWASQVLTHFVYLSDCLLQNLKVHCLLRRAEVSWYLKFKTETYVTALLMVHHLTGLLMVHHLTALLMVHHLTALLIVPHHLTALLMVPHHLTALLIVPHHSPAHWWAKYHDP